MSLATLHLVSAYTLWCVGTYSLWLGEWEDVFAYPILMTALAVLAFFVSDRGPRFSLSSAWSNWLGVVILVKILYDLIDNPQEALTALAHFLCFLQVAKWFREKIPRDFLLLYLMNILQVAIGAILAKQSSFGLIVATYFLGTIWCGMLFFLATHRGAIHATYGSTVAAVAPPPLWAIAARTLRVGGLAALLALAIFWLLPRTTREIDLASTGRTRQQWTGFSSVVSLENETKILENSDIALTVVSAVDSSGNSIELPQDILWRGNVFSTFKGNDWKRSRADSNLRRLPKRPPSIIATGHWALELEKVASTGNILFAPAGIQGADVSSGSLSVKYVPGEERIVLDDDAIRPRVRYTVVVDPKRWTEGIQDDEVTDFYLDATRQVPGNLQRTAQLAARLTDGVPAEDVRGKIDRIYRHLTESGEYEYALAAPQTDATLQPIEDFLFVRKTGHCEYFATGLALLLRHAGIPARLVTGFKGLDQNRAGGYFQVRQLYAHAWVEAFVPGEKKWVTLDPTPGEARTSGIERQRNWWNLVEDVRDVFTRIWGYYIVNFSIEDQQRVVNAITARTVEWVGVPMSRLQEILSHAWSENALLVVFLGVALAIPLAAGVYGSLRILSRWWKTRPRRGRFRETRTVEYQDWLDLLARHHLTPPATQTPFEIASLAQKKLAAHAQTARWSYLPEAFAQAWCRHRFGHEELAPEVWSELDSARQALEKEWNRSLARQKP